MPMSGGLWDLVNKDVGAQATPIPNAKPGVVQAVPIPNATGQAKATPVQGTGGVTRVEPWDWDKSAPIDQWYKMASEAYLSGSQSTPNLMKAYDIMQELFKRDPKAAKNPQYLMLNRRLQVALNMPF